FLGGAGQPLPAGSVLAGLPSGEEPVLVEMPASIERELPQLNVVLLGAREVEDRGSEAVLLHRPQVDLQALVEFNARLGLALAENGGDFVVAGERVGQLGGVVRNSDDVDVSHALLAAPVRPCDLESPYAV